MTAETKLRRQLRERDHKISDLESELRRLAEELRRQARASYYASIRQQAIQPRS